MTKNEIEKQEHYYWIDALRFVSVLLVIVVHVSGPIVYEWQKVPFQDFMIGNLYDSFSRISVPIFFMISGYLLLSKQESVKNFYKKRMKKVFIPFIAWSIIYLLWEGYFLKSEYVFLGIKESIVYEILAEPTFGHLWFFYALIGIYVFVPVLRLFVSAASKSELWYLVILWVLSGPAISTIEKFSDISISSQFGFITGYFGYFILGYLLIKYTYTQRQIVSFFLSYLVLGIGTAVGTWYLSATKVRLFLYLYDYLAPNVILMTASFFIAFQYFGENKRLIINARMESIVKMLGETSFGVYLVHGIVLTSLENGYFGFVLSYKLGNPLFSVPLTVIAIYLISLIITLLLRKIPVVRAIVW
ncbi:MAG: acyltransferase family protein [Anaerolineae bacterium]|jgi:surface polysaccharide O-acyltransferase-like enzyme|nr:acyltransferase family protein [Anaerolineae bacterium]MBT7192268.1 acyltransferase family protein [Anaerolineae bacterium]MBT7990925.1 acyltransferase family protein [Anaerolineae bacterium]